tara:strand:- start:805 stop:1680 length:876 start_codon:yes stop_codon:yes gene_type:complete
MPFWSKEHHSQFMKYLILLLTGAVLTFSKAKGQTPKLEVSPIPKGKLMAFEPGFSKYINVFGVHVFGTKRTPDSKIIHAATVLAEYLDNDEDGKPDNLKVVDALSSRDAYLEIFANERELERVHKRGKHFEEGFHYGISQFVEETNPGNGRFDATLEEVFHLITHHGYGNAYPRIFGVRSGTEIAKCLDLARKGHFVHVPNSYPEGAWFTYDDKSCEYGCMITEYIYWAMTSMLGAQKSIHRQREIAHEWRLPTRELVRKGDPDVYKLLIDPKYKFPKKLPDGKYKLKILD